MWVLYIVNILFQTTPNAPIPSQPHLHRCIKFQCKFFYPTLKMHIIKVGYYRYCYFQISCFSSVSEVNFWHKHCLTTVMNGSIPCPWVDQLLKACLMCRIMIVLVVQPAEHRLPLGKHVYHSSSLIFCLEKNDSLFRNKRQR